MPGWIAKHRARPEPEAPTCPTCRIVFVPEERHCSSPNCTWWICDNDETVYDSAGDRVLPSRPRS